MRVNVALFAAAYANKETSNESLQTALQTHYAQLAERVMGSKSSVVVTDFVEWEGELYQAFNNTEPDESTMKDLVSRGSSLNLKVMVSLYAPEKADKMTGYGCYCFPELHERLKGPPLDSVDTLCRRLVWGHKCLEKDYEGCVVEQTAYKWQNVDGSAVCLDQENTCAGEICRLDKAFSEELTEIYEWSTELEKINGFTRDKRCPMSTASLRAIIAKEPNGDAEINKSQCCGKQLNRTLYKPDKFDCCIDGTVARTGEC